MTSPKSRESSTPSPSAQGSEKVFGIGAPAQACKDRKCPFHGGLKVKQELLKGKVIRKDLNRSATIEWMKPLYLPKYERFEMRRVRLRVHNPACLDTAVGEHVVVARTRPLSKTKNHVIIQKLSLQQGYRKQAQSTGKPSQNSPGTGKKTSGTAESREAPGGAAA